MENSRVEITRLLEAWREGDNAALDALTPLVHKELRLLARRCLQQERSNAALQTTELVSEAYLKLVDCSRVRWQDRAHFFAISAQLMRRTLVDLARSRRYAKRGGEAIRVTFDETLEGHAVETRDWIRLDDTLK